MSNGQLLITPKNIEILGGNVEALVTKWEISKSLADMKGKTSNKQVSHDKVIVNGRFR